MDTSSLSFVSKTTDEYTPTLRWVSCLSNNETIFHDERPNLPPSWIRLKEYCQKNQIDINRVLLEFMAPGHVEISPENKDGYYFSKGAGADWGSDRTEKYFVFGHLEDTHVHLDWWLVPELIIRRSQRIHLDNISEDELRRFLIINPSCLKLNTSLERYNRRIESYESQEISVGA